MNNRTTRETLFTKIFQQNDWGNNESRSGPGSTITYTENLRNRLPELVTKYNVESILDIPCGDFNWMNKVNLPSNVNYTGGDIVADLIDHNKQNYSAPNIQFQVMDLLTSKLPTVDLVICRDCLFHFPIEDNIVALNNIKASKSRYLLLTGFPMVTENMTTELGKYFPYNYALPPFNFTDPLDAVDDWIQGYDTRSMFLYDIAKLKTQD